MDEEWLPWRTAMERALYGSAGFFVRERPADHFRTSVHVSELFAGAVAELLLRVDAALGHPDELAFIDMGAGRAELSLALLRLLPPPVLPRLRLYAVERAAPPRGLDPRVRWTPSPPRAARGLLFANEWLDNVPVPVAEADAAGVARYVDVRADGTERLGAPVAGADAAWLQKWWPLGAATAGQAGHGGRTPDAADQAGPGSHALDTGQAGCGSHTPNAGQAGPYGRTPDTGHAGLYDRTPSASGARAEIGLPRDDAWASAVASLAAGLAVAVDYGHTRATRPPYGTLTGYRHGRQVPPVPDGTCDLTAHVALDSLPGTPLTQRAALHALGVTGRRPPLTLASTDPAAYVRALSTATEAAELTAPGGLGAFSWLTTPVGPACAHLLTP